MNSVLAGIFLLMIGVPAMPIWASSIEGVAVERMLLQSSLVFEGVVTEHEPGVRTAAGSIRTCVLFEVLEVVKGAAPADELRLCFSGGTIGDLTLVVTGSVIPEVGSRGIYFVESIERQLVNPLFGWTQGHFRIESSVVREGDASQKGASVDRVLTERRRPVLGLGRGTSDETPRLSSGVATGVVEGDRGKPESALGPAQFKLRIRALLRELEE
jgi:hypothetical protein